LRFWLLPNNKQIKIFQILKTNKMRRIQHLVILLFISINLFAQAPQKMTYQAVIRNASNNLVVNVPVKMKISILQGSESGTAVFSELHNPTTNANGLATIEIGSGTSQVGSIGSINWGNGTYFLKTETDPTNSTNYSIVGTSQLLSVPYALYSGNGVKGISATGDTLSLGNGDRYIIPGIKKLDNPPATLNNGLVGYWPFNGNANDESGNGNNGVVNGNLSLTTDRFGNPNKAYLFPGSSSAYIDCGSSSSLKISQNISMCAWILMDGGFFNPRVISYEGASTTGYVMSVAGTSNSSRNLEALIYKGNGQGVGFCCGGTSGIQVPALSWQYVVFTADNGVGKLYLNGQLLKTSNGVVINESNYINSLNIGRKNASGFDAWGGKLDEIRIYNRALTQEEITWLANN
jgi:hypothetical protein